MGLRILNMALLHATNQLSIQIFLERCSKILEMRVQQYQGCLLHTRNVGGGVGVKIRAKQKQKGIFSVGSRGVFLCCRLP